MHKEGERAPGEEATQGGNTTWLQVQTRRIIIYQCRIGSSIFISDLLPDPRPSPFRLPALSGSTRGTVLESYITSAYLHWGYLFQLLFKELLVFPVRKAWAMQFVCPSFNFKQSRLTVLWTWSCAAPGSVDRGCALVRDNHHFSNNEYHHEIETRHTSRELHFIPFFSIPSFFKKNHRFITEHVSIQHTYWKWICRPVRSAYSSSRLQATGAFIDPFTAYCRLDVLFTFGCTLHIGCYTTAFLPVNYLRLSPLVTELPCLSCCA